MTSKVINLYEADLQRLAREQPVSPDFKVTFNKVYKAHWREKSSTSEKDNSSQAHAQENRAQGALTQQTFLAKVTS
ncbi:hypothetical protein [Pseudomonas alkylphenolica]|uniref:hypothetical protein n=1 Tax=Pseudomonas alkylphenolica TaxID=237609 RepID=UPI000FEBEEE0|nr:hypothetical protein [Pseudomonas alkylphenolica]